MLMLATRTPDGSVHTRSWMITDCSAAQLAQTMGAPRTETITDAAAAQAGADALAAHPGYLEIAADEDAGDGRG